MQGQVSALWDHLVFKSAALNSTVPSQTEACIAETENISSCSDVVHISDALSCNAQEI
jgi:hypothetical protein